MGWVIADTAITGVIYPLLNTMILAFLGAADAVLFTSIATVSGLLAIPLNFMRLRLLKEHSRLDIVVSAASVVAAVVVLLVLELVGVFGYLFGPAWTESATLLPLLLACAWRAASLATTIPFAALRRAGAVRLLTGLARDRLGAHLRAGGDRPCRAAAFRRCSSASSSPSSRRPLSTRSPAGVALAGHAPSRELGSAEPRSAEAGP